MIWFLLLVSANRTNFFLNRMMYEIRPRVPISFKITIMRCGMWSFPPSGLTTFQLGQCAPTLDGEILCKRPFRRMVHMVRLVQGMKKTPRFDLLHHRRGVRLTLHSGGRVRSTAKGCERSPDPMISKILNSSHTQSPTRMRRIFNTLAYFEIRFASGRQVAREAMCPETPHAQRHLAT